jgi:hypothetical protein
MASGRDQYRVAESSNDRGLRQLTEGYLATTARRIILEGALLYTSRMLRIPDCHDAG